ncbi:hypothetical protein BDU57DRAFT_589640 [Ampelomyces quisqualis]|uniref:C2H2-type domain-containing protein n=1 Tax=Ampelomyces quisqualis TaxID=50730 RepID=A0A6A5QD66_AMPQU|nr:hypothetical protein BDU57DRAFT_589640 [Ampelomyces quisqualis]
MASRKTSIDEPSAGNSPEEKGLMMKVLSEPKPTITTTPNIHTTTTSRRNSRSMMLQSELASFLRQNLLSEQQQKNATSNTVAKRQQNAASPPFQNIGRSIERWQADTNTQKDDDIGVGPIGSLFDSIVELLGFILTSMRKRPSISRHYQSLESSSAALFFWGTDLDVSQGELDEALHDSLQLRDTCLLVLVSIGELITNSIVRLFSSKENEDEFFPSAAITTALCEARHILGQQHYPVHQSEQDEEVLFRALRAKINNLINLGPSLASPAEENFDDQEPRIVEHFDEHLPEQTFINGVSQRFPRAAPAMVTHLGQLNWKRYDHMLFLQRTASQPEVGMATIERAKTIFHDSALGSSAAAQSEAGLIATPDPSHSQSIYAPTVVSSRASASHKRLPSLPPQARSGMLFTCFICNRQVKYRRTKDWKKHIFDDVLAYACPFAECSIADAFFQDSGAMMDHLEECHALDVSLSEVVCPICLDYSSSDRDTLSLHLSRHMEEIALAILPSAVDSDNDSQSESDNDSADRSQSRIDKISAVQSESESETENFINSLDPSDRRLVAESDTDSIADQASWSKHHGQKMGKYTFSWEHAANDVFVTGTFDDWRKTIILERVEGVFKKTVELPKVQTQYKFVVDGNWTINDSAKKEDDGHGIINNVIQPEDIIDEPVGTLPRTVQSPNISGPYSNNAAYFPEDVAQHTGVKRRSHRSLTSPARSMPVNKIDRFGATRLARESEKGDLAALKAVYEQAPSELDQLDYAGISPLQKASLHGWTDVVRFLLSKGCNTICESSDGETPLMDAVENGHLAVVDLLLNVAKVDPHHTNRKGQRAIDVLDHEDDDSDAIEKLLMEAMKNTREFKKNERIDRPRTGRLLYNEYNVETLIEKARDGDVLSVGELINSNIKPNLASGVAAANGGHFDVLSILLASGLKADHDPAKHTHTPMKAAIAGGHLNIVQLLLEQDGFNPTRRNKNNRTYYEYAGERNTGSTWNEIQTLLKKAFDDYNNKSAFFPTTKSTMRRRLISGKEKASREGQRRPTSLGGSPTAAQHNQQSSEASADSIDTIPDKRASIKDTWQCTFCLQHVVPASWRRHEETQHYQKHRWTCLATDPRLTVNGSYGETSICAFCQLKDPSDEHLLDSHRILDCSKKTEAERTFSSPDHLRQHIKNFHKSSMLDIVRGRWRSNRNYEEDENGWACGFCMAKLSTWDERATHIAHHFKDGMTMASWRTDQPPSTR